MPPPVNHGLVTRSELTSTLARAARHAIITPSVPQASTRQARALRESSIEPISAALHAYFVGQSPYDSPRLTKYAGPEEDSVMRATLSHA